MLISIEGIDGSGKRTQTALLEERARKHGLRITTFAFPRYGTNTFARSISAYLRGDFGQLHAVSPYLASLLYAGDRFAAKAELDAATRLSDLVICDRYTASNIAHQAARLPASTWSAFIEWLSDIEHGIYSLPKPDLNLFLDVPVPVASRLIRERKDSDSSTPHQDIHEENASYLQACREVYQHLASGADHRRWVTIPCTDAQGLLQAPHVIHDAVWNAVSPHLITTTSQ